MVYMDRIGRVVSSDSSSLHVWDPFLGASIGQFDVNSSGGAGAATAAGGGVGGSGAAGQLGAGSANVSSGESGQRNPPLTTLAALPPALVIAANTDGVLRLFDLRTHRYANALKVTDLSELDPVKLTVKAPNFVLHGNFGPFIARSVSSSGELCVKMNRTDFAHRKFVYNFYSIHFSVERVLITARSSEKKKKTPKFP